MSISEPEPQKISGAAWISAKVLGIRPDDFGFLIQNEEFLDYVFDFERIRSISPISSPFIVATLVHNPRFDACVAVQLSIARMLHSGKVAASEIRGVMSEHIPGIFCLAATALGVDNQRFQEMLERGELVAEEFLTKLANHLDQVYGKKNEQG